MKQDVVLLEGFHVCKHALRFNADLVDLLTPDKEALTVLLQEYAPDIQEQTLALVREVPLEEFAQYSSVSIRTPLAGKARIPKLDYSSYGQTGVIVYLDNPRNLENIGAVVRTAAALGVSMVVTSGEHNPWHKNVLRGAQGLHFAIQVCHEHDLPEQWWQERPVIVCDQSGEDMTTTQIASNSVIVFGSERSGVSGRWLQRSTGQVSIPQAQGVSSYSLSHAVAIALYHTTYCQ